MYKIISNVSESTPTEQAILLRELHMDWLTA